MCEEGKTKNWVFSRPYSLCPSSPPLHFLHSFACVIVKQISAQVITHFRREEGRKKAKGPLSSGPHLNEGLRPFLSLSQKLWSGGRKRGRIKKVYVVSFMHFVVMMWSGQVCYNLSHLQFLSSCELRDREGEEGGGGGFFDKRRF